MSEYLESGDLLDSNVASAFDELSFWSARFGNLLFQHLELVRDIKALDVACGTGFPLCELSQVHGASCDFTGVDIWKDALARAQLKIKTYGLNNARLVNADVAFLPFPDATFNLVISHLGINNFADQRAALAECFRVAAFNARFVLTTNLKGHMKEFYEVYRRLLRTLGLERYGERLARNEDHRGTRESFARLVEESGFRVSKLVEDQFAFRFVDGSALLRHFLTRIGFLQGWRSVVDSSDEQLLFQSLEAALNEMSREQGGLNLTIPMLYLEAQKGER
jgi:ubiquinone/menaquinone biosynthesis C-methylase UbiE